MEDLHFLRLWDIYYPLLTEMQQEITNLYFNYDLSLAEIAEEKNCSRQCVSECLNTCRKKVEEYEEKLHVSRTVTELTRKTSLLVTQLRQWSEQENLTQAQRQALEKMIEQVL